MSWLAGFASGSEVTGSAGAMRPSAGRFSWAMARDLTHPRTRAQGPRHARPSRLSAGYRIRFTRAKFSLKLPFGSLRSKQRSFQPTSSEPLSTAKTGLSAAQSR